LNAIERHPKSLNILKLWGRVLAKLLSSMDNKLVWSALSAADFIVKFKNAETPSLDKALVEETVEKIVKDYLPCDLSYRDMFSPITG